MIEYFTSESVSCGHPDKICDQVSDAILDEFLKQDKESKVACECFITNNLLVIGGEAHTNASVDIIGTAKKVIEEIGYNGSNGFNPETAVFVNTLHEQSSDIRQGVEKENLEEQGAGDQGIMFGYACKETKQLMPLPIVLSSEMMKSYDTLRKNGKLEGMNPDAKCQFTVLYKDGKPIKTHTIVLSMQHEEYVMSDLLYHNYVNIVEDMKKNNPDFAKFLEPDMLFINPTGSFVIGGPEGDTGLTGRKIIVDTYGGKCPHGGGAFSGKDPSKVDRSACYYARYIAKNIVAADIAKEITIQLSYAIGIDEPIGIYVKGTNLKYTEEEICKMIYKVFNPTPYNIIKKLNLKNPIYQETATYGHFSNEKYAWEQIDMINEIKNYFTV